MNGLRRLVKQGKRGVKSEMAMFFAKTKKERKHYERLMLAADSRGDELINRLLKTEGYRHSDYDGILDIVADLVEVGL